MTAETTTTGRSIPVVASPFFFPPPPLPAASSPSAMTMAQNDSEATTIEGEDGEEKVAKVDFWRRQRALAMSMRDDAAKTVRE